MRTLANKIRSRCCRISHIRYFHRFALIECAKFPFGPREHGGSRRKLRFSFYLLVGRVRALSVPSRRHGALNEDPRPRQKIL